MNACLLTLIATPDLEEQLVDWLLEAGRVGFTTLQSHGHGVRQDQLSSAEQVAGRQRRVVFWLQLTETEAREVVAGLAERFGGAGLHFWIAPVIAAGPILPRFPVPGADGREGT